MLKVIDCDFSNPAHRQAVKFLMEQYMKDEMGDHPVHDEEKAEKMVDLLDKHPSKMIVLVEYNDEFVGLSNCFINVGTFAVKPFVNIHDVVVWNKYRGIGAGRALMQGIIDRAQKLGCGKITLEVREDNTTAQKLYQSCGFHEGNPPMYFWSKYFNPIYALEHRK